MKKVKIIHFVPGFDHGGIESRLLDWYKEIDREKYQFDLIKTTVSHENKLIDEFRELGGKVYTIPKFSPKNYNKFKSKISEIFSNNNYNVVHCHSPSTGNFILKIAKKYRVPIRIMHARTNQFDKSTSFLLYRKYLKRKTLKNSNVYLACSKSAGEWMFGKTNKFEVIKNGIYVNHFKYNLEKRIQIRKQLKLGNAIVIGYVSRLSPSKNHLLLLDIVKDMRVRGKNIKLLIIGDGPYKGEIIKKIKYLEIEENVMLLGQVNNVNDYYQAMDFFIFPSEYEGFGTVAIESQASGLKTLVSDRVPTDVDLTKLVERVSLSAELSEWIDAIESNYPYLRYDTSQEVIDAGFDVKESVRKLESIYNKNL